MPGGVQHVQHHPQASSIHPKKCPTYAWVCVVYAQAFSNYISTKYTPQYLPDTESRYGVCSEKEEGAHQKNTVCQSFIYAMQGKEKYFEDLAFWF